MQRCPACAASRATPLGHACVARLYSEILTPAHKAIKCID
ncbi:hypothetical protein HMPREF0762_01481 [Slackia exigua ATCC 700122]|uniref:Uncharacterized protein n=1 Tax=Slackia exigua (strain ATCC 700122 / DSM 15923 / CIP 105133 / JCM 11022 / KCTC 5966 / S-7) TaxID=649764 RepID=D0WI09_SLAES|nr:hypothetical protein HMPREF0762_01481 [Slackia exigua ATCC 700122]